MSNRAARVDHVAIQVRILSLNIQLPQKKNTIEFRLLLLGQLAGVEVVKPQRIRLAHLYLPTRWSSLSIRLISHRIVLILLCV